jgi:integrase
VKRHLALLSGVFNKAIAWSKTKLNPIKDVKLLKENNERVRYLTDEEELILKPELADKHWLKVQVAINTGLRRGEQFNLKWTEINFPTRTITIRQSKSGEMRHVRMNDRVTDIFRALPSRLKSQWVFPSGTGETPLDANNFINRVFNPALERANICDFRWHDLRHTFASPLML